MGKYFTIKKHFDYSFLYLFFWIFVFAGAGLFVFLTQFQLMRLWIPIVLFFIFYKNISFRLGYYTKFWLLFFCAYSVYTFVISIFTNVSMNDMINFFILILIIILNCFIFSDIKINTLKLFIHAVDLFFLITTIIAVYEIITKRHLPVSRVNEWVDFKKFTPSTFYANPNDYVCVLWLLHFTKIFLKKDFFSEKCKFCDFVTFTILIIMSFITGARLIQLVIIVFILIYLLQKFPRFVIFFFCMGVIYLFFSKLDVRISEKITEEFSNHGSNEIRKNLYISAIRSFTRYDNILGYGINQSVVYFQRDLNSDLYTGDILAPHSYIFEVLLNSGFFFMCLTIIIPIFQFVFFYKKKKYHIAAFSLCYLIVLFSAASSLFLWPHYICYTILFVTQDIIVDKRRYR